MDYRALRYFLTVAEELNFRRAAERLHIAQPPLSRRIARLEADVGVQLLVRTKRKVELTAAGKSLVHDAQRVLSLTEQAARRAQRVALGQIGELRIGSVSTADLSVFPTILPAFQRRFPDIHLILKSLTVMEQIQALRALQIDIGFIRLPVADSSLKIDTILREPLVLAIPKGHRLAALRRVPLGELAGERYISLPRHVAPGFYDAMMTIFRKAGFSPNISQEADDFQTHLSLIAMGFGVSVLPGASVHVLTRADVLFRRLADPVPRVDLGVAYRRDDSSEALQAFVALTREVSARNLMGHRYDRGAIFRRH